MKSNRLAKWHIALACALTILVSACSGGKSLTLLELSETHSGSFVEGKLIACAAGGQEMFMAGPDGGPAPVAVFFYPPAGATDFRLFELKSFSADYSDLSQYREVTVPSMPVFNGYLRMFPTDYGRREAWVVVTYLQDGALHTSGFIHLKGGLQPSQFAPELVDFSAEESVPKFAWQDGRIAENDIYFQVISDLDGNLISGTYTKDRNFTFYDVSNVVINIRDISPPPALVSGEKYHFTLMGVSEDNWVNLIARTEFTAP